MLERKNPFFLLILMAGTLWLGSAQAELTRNPAELKKGSRTYAYIFSPAAQKAMFKIGKYWDKLLDIEQGCNSQTMVDPVGIRILSPINLPNSSAHPTAGIWQVSFKFVRCNKSKLYNAIFISKNGAIPSVKPYFPGNSLANSKLINDALQSAYAAASEQIADDSCKDMTIYDMNIDKPPHTVIANGKSLPGVWDEKWSFQGCKQVVGVHMTFVPDGHGNVRFNARPLKPLHKVEPLPKYDPKTRF